MPVQPLHTHDPEPSRHRRSCCLALASNALEGIKGDQEEELSHLPQNLA